MANVSAALLVVVPVMWGFAHNAALCVQTINVHFQLQVYLGEYEQGKPNGALISGAACVEVRDRDVSWKALSKLSPQSHLGWLGRRVAGDDARKVYSS